MVCNHFIGRNKVVFCIFGMAQGKSRVGVFHSRVYLGQWPSDHKLPPGQRSVDWANLLLPLRMAATGKQSGHPGWLASFLRELACTGNPLKALLTGSNPGPVGGPGLVHYFWWAWGMQGCWPRGRTEKHGSRNAKTESSDTVVRPSPFLFQLSRLSDFMHALITSANRRVHLSNKGKGRGKWRLVRACLSAATVFYSLLSCWWK